MTSPLTVIIIWANIFCHNGFWQETKWTIAYFAEKLRFPTKLTLIKLFYSSVTWITRRTMICAVKFSKLTTKWNKQNAVLLEFFT